MNYKLFCIFVLLSFATGNLVLAENQTSNSPSAMVVEDIFEFKPVLEGTEVINNFIIQNKGTAPLKILEINPD